MNSKRAKLAYAGAVTLYRQRRYQDAAKVFLTLVMQDPVDWRYQKGGGACLQMLGQYDKACACYGLAAALNPNDPTSLFHLSECFLALGAREQAVEAAQEFLNLSEQRDELETMRHTARQIFQLHQEPS